MLQHKKNHFFNQDGILLQRAASQQFENLIMNNLLESFFFIVSVYRINWSVQDLLGKGGGVSIPIITRKSISLGNCSHETSCCDLDGREYSHPLYVLVQMTLPFRPMTGYIYTCLWTNVTFQQPYGHLVKYQICSYYTIDKCLTTPENSKDKAVRRTVIRWANILALIWQCCWPDVDKWR